MQKTTAKVTSLQQAAKVRGMNTVEIVNALREEARLLPLGDSFCPDSKDIHIPFLEKTLAKDIIHTLDVRSIIEAGYHPKDQTITLTNTLKK